MVELLPTGEVGAKGSSRGLSVGWVELEAVRVERGGGRESARRMPRGASK